MHQQNQHVFSLISRFRMIGWNTRSWNHWRMMDCFLSAKLCKDNYPIHKKILKPPPWLLVLRWRYHVCNKVTRRKKWFTMWMSEFWMSKVFIFLLVYVKCHVLFPDVGVLYKSWWNKVWTKTPGVWKGGQEHRKLVVNWDIACAYGYSLFLRLFFSHVSP